MDNSRLDKDLIAQPHLWSLAMQVQPDRLDVALFPPVEREEPVCRTFALSDSAPTTLKALEDAIYDNPLLLSDFRKVSCGVASQVMMALPAEATIDDGEKLMATAFPDAHGEITVCDCGADNARIFTVIDPEIAGFLRRTFYNIRLTHRLAPLCSWLTDYAGHSSRRRMYAIVRRGHIDVIALDDKRLLLLNSFAAVETVDAAYYLLACRQELGLDPTDDDMVIGGEPDVAQPLALLLRRYLKRVMPLPYPALRFRPSPTLTEAPTELLIMSLFQ